MKKETKEIWKYLFGNLLFQMFAIILGATVVYEISRRFAGIGMDIWISTGSAIAVTIGMLGLIAVIIVYHTKYYWELQKKEGTRKMKESEQSEASMEDVRPYKLLAEFLGRQDITDEELIWIIENVWVNPLKEQAGRIVLQRGSTNNKTLCSVVSRVESLREEAARKLLKQSPDKEELWCLFEWMDSNIVLQVEAGEKLLVQLGSNNECYRLLDWCEARIKNTENEAYKSFLSKVHQKLRAIKQKQ